MHDNIPNCLNPWRIRIIRPAPYLSHRSPISPTHTDHGLNQNNVPTETTHTATARRTLPSGLGEARPPGPRLGSPASSVLHGEAHKAAAGIRHRTGSELGDEPGGAGLRVPRGAAQGHACLKAVRVVLAVAQFYFVKAVGGARTCVCLLSYRKWGQLHWPNPTGQYNAWKETCLFGKDTQIPDLGDEHLVRVSSK